jgi:hypothetical protein
MGLSMSKQEGIFAAVISASVDILASRKHGTPSFGPDSGEARCGKVR